MMKQQKENPGSQDAVQRIAGMMRWSSGVPCRSRQVDWHMRNTATPYLWTHMGTTYRD